MRSVVITGVSSGIGRAAAADLVQHGYHVFGSVRREATAQDIVAEFGDRFTPLVFDVTDVAAVRAAARRVGDVMDGRSLAGLVNNAGVTVFGPLMHLPLDDLRHQLEVNVVGLVAVTQAFLPLLGARPDAPRPAGRIVNLSSVSGRISYPFMGAYAASKHAVEAVSDAMRRELVPYGVDVVVIEPGTVATPIVGKLGEQIGRFSGTVYGRALARVEVTVARRETSALPVEAVTRVIRLALGAERPRTRYPVPRARLAGWLLPRWLPDRLLDRVIARRLGLSRTLPG